MKTLKLLVAGAAIGVILLAFRDYERGGWLAPVLPWGGSGEGDEYEKEPILGYDSLDVDALLEWLEEARPDPDTLRRMREYEARHLAREAVLDELGDRLRAAERQRS
jgi:hypothetical protein